MGDSVERLNSQLYLTYYDIYDKSAEYYSATSAVDYGQFSFQQLDNGVRVEYILGQNANVYTIPAVIEKHRMEEFLARLNEEDREQLLMYYDLWILDDRMDQATADLYLMKYPTLKDSELYVCNYVTNIMSGTLSEMLGQQMESLFAKAGYTEDDMLFDYEENQQTIPMQDNPVFRVAVEYRLENGALTVRVPWEDIDFDESKYKLTDLSLLPFFGAADTSEQGYLIVPDGSGALIRFNNGKTRYEPYMKKLYGRDRSILLAELNDVDSTQAYLPIFGAKETNDAFLAVIESGGALATIHADTSGRYNQYNSVYSSFCLMPNSQQSATDLGMGEGMRNYQEQIMQSDIQIRYLLFPDKNVDYTSMALRYQQYLLDNDRMTAQPSGDAFPLFLNLLGAAKYNTTFLGIPVRSEKSLTTYAQAQEILEKLTDGGVKSIFFQYSGWCNGGLTNTVSTSVDLLSNLGGEEAFSALTKYISEQNISFFPDVDFTYVSEERLTKRFGASANAARDLSNAIAKDYRYELDLFRMDKNSGRFIVSPVQYSTYVEKFLKSYASLSVDGISVSNFGTDLNADYHKDKQIDRQQAQNMVVSALDNIQQSGYNYCVNGANEYALKNAVCVFNLPLDSGNAYILDESIPFYQIALHSILPYSGPALNQDADFKYGVLKAIETGASPYFEWTYSDSTDLKNIDLDVYSTDYSQWIDDAIDAYQEIDQAIGDCRDSKIVHHEKLQEGFYLTQYENGKTVYVNYNESDVQINGCTVKARDFYIKEAVA